MQSIFCKVISANGLKLVQLFCDYSFHYRDLNMLQDIVILLKEKFLYAIPFIILGWCLHIRYRHGFNKYRGPLLASFTDYWRYRYTRDHRDEIPSVALHAKYGDIVRAGPQKLSFANPEALKDIYSINRGYVKVCVRVKLLFI